MFNSLRSSQNVFQSSCTILHFYPQCMRIPISPHPHQFLLPFFFFFFNFSHLRGHEEVSHCGLELNFPKSSWHWTSFYMLVGYISSFEKCIFKRKWKWKLLSRARLFATLYSPWNSLWDSVQPMNSPGQNTGVGSVSHFQGIFPGIKSFFHMAGRFFTSWATREGLQSLKPFLVGLLVFLLVVRVLYIFWIQAPYWIYDL